MITLYATLGSGNCLKPFLAMTQLQVSFSTILLDVLKGETRKAEYLATNPSGTVPYLVLADGRGIGESNAILWHVAEGSHLIPTDRYDRAKALQWMFFEQSRLEPFISPARFFTSIVPDQRSERERDIAVWQERACKGLELLNHHLADRQFLVADRYSVADISVYGYVHLAEGGGIKLADYPAIHDWLAQVERTENFVPLSSLSQLAEKFGEAA